MLTNLVRLAELPMNVPLMEVAVAAPSTGVTSVGVLVIATLPVPLMVSSSGAPVPDVVRPMMRLVVMCASFASPIVSLSIVH